MTSARLAAKLFCLALLSLLSLLVIVPHFPSLVVAQDLDKPLQNIDDEITAFSFAPDSRIVYSTKRTIKTKKYDLQHDDIWLQDSNGKRRRILQGDKFTKGTEPFSYAVDAFHWSHDGRAVLAQLFTTTVVDDSGRTQDSFMTLAFEDSGKEIHFGKGEDTIQDCYNATWLKDNATVIYFNEAVKPRMLFSFRYFNIATGPAGPAFEGRTFLDYDRIPGTNSAIAVERDRALSGPPRLQRLELLAQDATELATLDDYAGGLSVSPTGSKVAYFIDRENLEVRDLKAPDHFVRLRVGLGVFHWAPDETRILLKRAIERKTADIVWIDIPPLPPELPGKEVPVLQPTPRPILHGLAFREFAISPDGRFLGVVLPGKRNLMIFPLPN
ncbi:MAG: hypothetical protein WBG02_02180 [Candidatus Acidiferrum sp.]